MKKSIAFVLLAALVACDKEAPPASGQAPNAVLSAAKPATKPAEEPAAKKPEAPATPKPEGSRTVVDVAIASPNHSKIGRAHV